MGNKQSGLALGISDSERQQMAPIEPKVKKGINIGATLESTKGDNILIFMVIAVYIIAAIFTFVYICMRIKRNTISNCNTFKKSTIDFLGALDKKQQDSPPTPPAK